MLKKVSISLIALFIIIQFFRPEMTNPSVKADLQADPEIKQLIKQSCYDCHSNETRWPWYASVAPASWWVAGDVDEARRELNFSQWEQFETRRKIRKLNEMKEEIENELMPLPEYVFMHSSAELSADGKQKIINWVDEQIYALENPNVDTTTTKSE